MKIMTILQETMPEVVVTKEHKGEMTRWLEEFVLTLGAP
ncbi:unnamed protein product, partial [Urochloa humidicola]